MIIFSQILDLNRPSTKQLTLTDSGSDAFLLKLSAVLNGRPYEGTILLKKNGEVLPTDDLGRYRLSKAEGDGDVVVLKAEAEGIIQDVIVKYVKTGVTLTDEGGGQIDPAIVPTYETTQDGQTLVLGETRYKTLNVAGFYEDGEGFSYNVLAQTLIQG